MVRSLEGVLKGSGPGRVAQERWRRSDKDRMVFTAIGRAINIAARLEKAADADGILVSRRHLLRAMEEHPEGITLITQI